MQHKTFCVREFIKTESPTAVQRAFLLRFNIQPPTRKSICRWNHRFEKIDCLCKGKSSSRPRVSEENVRWIQESFERSPRKSNRRACRELGIPQPTVWCVLGRRLLFKPYRLQLVQVLWVHLFESPFILFIALHVWLPGIIIRPYINTKAKKYIEQANSFHCLGNISCEKEMDVDNKFNNF